MLVVFFFFDPGKIRYRASVRHSSCFFYLLTHHNLYPPNEIPGYAPANCMCAVHVCLQLAVKRSFRLTRQTDSRRQHSRHASSSSLLYIGLLYDYNVRNEERVREGETREQGRWSHRIIVDIKEDWGSGGQKLKLFFVKLHIIFTLKYNKQQLLLLLDKINLAAKYTFKNIFFTFNFSSTKIQQICHSLSLGIWT